MNDTYKRRNNTDANSTQEDWRASGDFTEVEKDIVQDWLNKMAHSVALRDLEMHMGLVSKNVQVYGIPGIRQLGHHDWKGRRRNEFEQNLLHSLSYDCIKIKTAALRRLIFSVEETMQAMNDNTLIIDKVIVLELEQDKVWRVVEERIRNWTPNTIRQAI